MRSSLGAAGVPCPIKDVPAEDIDMIFVRENTEGEYAGSGSWLYKNKPNEVVIQNGVYSPAWAVNASSTWDDHLRF